MKTMVNGLLYDTDMLELVFNLDENTPKSGGNYNTYTSTASSGDLVTSNNSSNTWYTVNYFTATLPQDPNFKYENYIAKSKKDNFVIVTVKSVKTERNVWTPIERKIIRYFKDKNSVRDYLSEKFGFDDRCDVEIRRFFEKFGITIENA